MKSTGLFIAMVLVTVAAVLLRSAAGLMGSYGMYGFGSNSLSAVFSLVLWALTAGGSVLVIIWHARNTNRTLLLARSGYSALEMSKTRSALGEITTDQFDAAKRDLGA